MEDEAPLQPVFRLRYWGANCREAPPEDEPERPWWLGERGVGETSAMVRCTFEAEDMPKWTQDAATSNEYLVLLGDVK